MTGLSLEVTMAYATGTHLANQKAARKVKRWALRKGTSLVTPMVTTMES
jgi:hypothetical protein